MVHVTDRVTPESERNPTESWWHAVLNLDHTVAVTQNYVSSARFDKVWRMTNRGRPKMSKKWLQKLRRTRPDLAARAVGPIFFSTSSFASTSSSSCDCLPVVYLRICAHSTPPCATAHVPKTPFVNPARGPTL
jgi:hypothetical protein